MYDGKCKSVVRMGDELFKEEFGIRCGLKWPCKKQCQEDFGLACPTGWFLLDGTCVADSAYAGPCVPFAALAKLDTDAKQFYGEKCNVEFCHEAHKETEELCDPDIASNCPLGWKSVGSRIGYCYGVDYRGACRPIVSMAFLEKAGRKAFAETCGVNWPCERHGAKDRAGHSARDQWRGLEPRGPIASDGRLFALP